jgi:hypothetical protein
MFIYHCCLLFGCLVLTVLNRRCWSAFSESTTLRLSIYTTTVLALITYVVEQTAGYTLIALYTKLYLLTFGTMCMLFMSFIPRIAKSARQTTLFDADSASQATQEHQRKALLASHSEHYEHSVHLKVYEGWFNLDSYSWTSATLAIHDSKHLILNLPRGTCGHLLSMLILIDKNSEVPYSFQLLGEDYTYWIKCPNAHSYTICYTLCACVCQLPSYD